MLGVMVRCTLVVCVCAFIDATFAQNDTSTSFATCTVNGTTLIGRLTADAECVICDADHYFDVLLDRCKQCSNGVTNNNKNILPSCIDIRPTSPLVNTTTHSLYSTENETLTTITEKPVYATTTAQTVEPDGRPKVSCTNENCCHLTLSGSKSALEKMLNSTMEIYSKYKYQAMDKLHAIGVSNWMTSLGLKNLVTNDINILSDSVHKEDISTNSNCIYSNALLVEDYFGSVKKLIDVKEFILLLPRILIDVGNEDCHASEDDDHEHEHDHDHDHDEEEEHEEEEEKSSLVVWLIAFASVFIISVLSVIGVLLVPVMRHYTFYNRLISFLVALAVGTLIGDALLHLLPHATGIHDHENESHEGHDHAEGEIPEDEDHFNTMWKGLMAVTGIYIFYLVETVMVIIKDIKNRKKAKRSTDMLAMKKSHSNSSHGHHQHNVHETFHHVSPLLEEEEEKTDNGQVQKILVPLKDKEDATNFHNRSHHQSLESMVQEDGPHTHVQGGTHIHMHDHEVPTSIANLAWMVVMGDGLHNFSDGLAIGAAFTSSIGAGLSTSIAVFCHELPHELGDFAILINAGMTVKQALLYNFLCACLAFVGLVIGMIIGEYTNTYKLWILAFTAGGFLYIALVDMIPQMLVSLRETDATVRFISQNIGLLLGISIMLLIALREHSFEAIFSS